MKILVKNILTTIVALALLIGSSGLQVYKHTCSMHSFSAVSFLKTPECEKDQQVIEETEDCCKAEVEEIAEPNCCESEPIEETNPISISSQEIECCVSSIESSQLQDNLFPPVGKKILTLELITAPSSFIEKEILQSEQSLVLHNNDLPPPIFGKQLLYSIHQLKLVSPIS